MNFVCKEAVMPFTLPLGAVAPDFCLPATDGNCYNLADFSSAKALVISFTCNHCPAVIGTNPLTRQSADRFIPMGAAFIGINSNTIVPHHDDSFKHMIRLMETEKYPWVYLRDEAQTAAAAYGALRTPHFFVFDESRQLVYTGRSVDVPYDQSKVTVNDLDNALEELFAGKPISVPLTNPIGCNVKWEGEDQHWMPVDACDLVLPVPK